MTISEKVEILVNKHKTDQQKYDELFDAFKFEGNLTRLPILIGLYTEDVNESINLKTKKINDDYTSNNSDVGINHGIAIKRYVRLLGLTSKNNIDEEVIETLTDKSKTDQQKYDELFDTFKNKGNLTRLPILIGLYAKNKDVVNHLKTRKQDGTNTSNNNDVEVRHGIALKEYVWL